MENTTSVSDRYVYSSFRSTTIGMTLSMPKGISHGVPMGAPWLARTWGLVKETANSTHMAVNSTTDLRGGAGAGHTWGEVREGVGTRDWHRMLWEQDAGFGSRRSYAFASRQSGGGAGQEWNTGNCGRLLSAQLLSHPVPFNRDRAWQGTAQGWDNRGKGVGGSQRLSEGPRGRESPPTSPATSPDDPSHRPRHQPSQRRGWGQTGLRRRG